VLRSLWLLALYLAFLGLGVTTPFVMTLGYVWVDTFRPQEVSYIILNEMPVAMIMGAGAFISYLLLDRRSPPPLMLPSVLQVLLAVWMTATLFWAELPDRAWIKWDWAFKSVAFAAFVPLVIRSRVQIEAFVQTYVFSLAANFVPFGLKVLISGGGYGQNLGLQGGNSGLAEGGQLSTVCLMAVPLALFLGRHGKLIPRLPLMNIAYGAVAVLAIITALGTYERSALVGLVMLGLYMFVRSRRKFLYGLCAGTLALVIVVGAASTWDARVSSIGDYNTDGSSLTRLLVWQWTLGYVTTHPLGGSFDAYGIDTIVMPPDALNPGGYVQTGRAWHSIYFEMLGELGWPGLCIFLLTAVSSLISLLRLSRKCRKVPDLAWVADMSDAVQTGILVFLSAGAFVGLAFQPPFWYFVSMGVCLRAYVWHAERTEIPDLQGWRLLAQQTKEAMAERAAGGWRGATPLPRDEPLRAPAWRRDPTLRRGES
jgi:probable O-glycosylation ligase (exosortase A-associated)